MEQDDKAIVIEGAKLMLQTYFAYARLANLTEQQLSEVYQNEKEKFLVNNPSKLEDV